jgi:hypothetical protein
MAEKKAVVNRMKSLTDVDGVTVKISDGGNTVRVTHKAHHSLHFLFKWVDGNHFVGYFLDADGGQSQAVVSLWSGLEAIRFATAYSLLLELRARQRA